MVEGQFCRGALCSIRSRCGGWRWSAWCVTIAAGARRVSRTRQWRCVGGSQR
jgi:hypothetical protein